MIYLNSAIWPSRIMIILFIYLKTPWSILYNRLNKCLHFHWWQLSKYQKTERKTLIAFVTGKKSVESDQMTPACSILLESNLMVPKLNNGGKNGFLNWLWCQNILTNTEVNPLRPGVKLVLVHCMQERYRLPAPRQTHQNLITGSHHVEFVNSLQWNIKLDHFINLNKVLWCLLFIKVINIHSHNTLHRQQLKVSTWSCCSFLKRCDNYKILRYLQTISDV